MSANAEIRKGWNKRGIKKHLRSRVAECIVAGITNEAIAKIAIIAGIAKIGKPSPTPLKHGGNGVSGGKTQEARTGIFSALRVRFV